MLPLVTFLNTRITIGWKMKPKLLLASVKQPGPQFNIKMTSYQYRKSHCGDKTIAYDRLISTMGFPILVRQHLYIESGPRLLGKCEVSYHPVAGYAFMVDNGSIPSEINIGFLLHWCSNMILMSHLMYIIQNELYVYFAWLQTLINHDRYMVHTEICEWNLMTFPWPFKHIFKQ